jgi:hypothetical protein
MSDLSLLDWAASETFAAGMAGSERSARRWTPEQVAAVDAAIGACAAFMPAFTADDVWKRLGLDFPVTKGMAARLIAAANRGMIRNTGTTTFSTKGGAHDHRQRLVIWESL